MNQSTQTLLEYSLDILETGPNHSWDDIEKQYRQLVQRCHPDRNTGENHEAAKKQFIEVNTAFKFVRAHYRKTGAIPRRSSPEQHSPLLGTKKQVLINPSVYKNKFVIASTLGVMIVALFAAVLLSLDSRLAENNRHRANAGTITAKIESTLPPHIPSATDEEATMHSSADMEFR